MSNLNEILSSIISEIKQGNVKSQEEIKISIHKLALSAKESMKKPFNADRLNDEIKELLKVISERIQKKEGDSQGVEFHKEMLSDILTIFPEKLLGDFITSEKSELSDAGFASLAKASKEEKSYLTTTYHPVVLNTLISAWESSLIKIKRMGKSADSLLSPESSKKKEEHKPRKRSFTFFHLKNPHAKKSISKSEENISGFTEAEIEKLYLKNYLYSTIQNVKGVTLNFPEQGSEEEKIECGVRYYRKIKYYFSIIMPWLNPESRIAFPIEEIKDAMHIILNELDHLYKPRPQLDINKPKDCFSPIQSNDFLEDEEAIISNRELLAKAFVTITSSEHISVLEEDLRNNFKLIEEKLTKDHIHKRVNALIEQDIDYILIALNIKKQDLSFLYKKKNILLGRLNSSLNSPNLDKDQKVLMNSLIKKTWCKDSIYLEALSELLCLRVFASQFVISELLQPIIDIAIFERLFEYQSAYPENESIANNIKHFVDLFKSTYLKSAKQNEIAISEKNTTTVANKDYFEDSPLNLEAETLKKLSEELEEIQGYTQGDLGQYRGVLQRIFNDLHIRICQSLTEFSFTQNKNDVPEKLRLVISLFHIVAENYYKENKKESFIPKQLYNNEFHRLLTGDVSKKSHVMSMTH